MNLRPVGLAWQYEGSPNLLGMPSCNDQQRSDLLSRYRRSGLTQDAFCAEVRRQGIDLSPRTLRSWIAKLEPPEGTVEACLQAVDLAMNELRRARGMLGTFCSEQCERHAAPAEPDRIEPEALTEAGLPRGIPSLEVETPSPSSSPMPDGVPKFPPPRKVRRLTWG